MIDPTLPVPQPEPASPPRKFSRRWIVAIVVVALLALGLGGAAYGVHAKGDAKAEEYSKAIDAWDDQRSDLVSAPAAANNGLWDFDDATTKKSLAKQRVACARVLTLRKSAAGNAAALPKADDSFFKLLSSAERRAIKASVAREKAVKAYAKAADKVLVQLHSDCVWNIRTNSVDPDASGSKKITAEADKLMLKRGHSEGNYYCPSTGKGDCLPATAAKSARFAELFLKSIKVDKAYYLKQFFKAGTCDSTSYVELCTAMKAAMGSYYGSLEKYGSFFKSLETTNGWLAQEFSRLEKNNKAADIKFKAAMFKAHPEFKTDYRVRNDVFWQEAFFDASARDSIADLLKFRKAMVGPTTI